MGKNEKNDELKDEKNNALTEGSNLGSCDDFFKGFRGMTFNGDPFYSKLRMHAVKDLSCLNEKPVPYRIFDKGTSSLPVILLPENLNENENT